MKTKFSLDTDVFQRGYIDELLKWYLVARGRNFKDSNGVCRNSEVVATAAAGPDNAPRAPHSDDLRKIVGQNDTMYKI